LAPVVVGASLEAFEMVKSKDGLRENLRRNTVLFRTRMKAAGFKILGE